MGEREREQRTNRVEPAAGGASLAGPRQVQLTALAATANETAPVQRLKTLSAHLNAAASRPTLLAKGAPVQRRADPPRPNNTGLPDRLKEGVEAMSGLSMDDVRVHRDSAMPAQLNAHAFAQGRDIHLGPGQERHLPYEAWHVVQQAQGRVRPTAQMKRDVPINDDAALEREADVMGARALGSAALPPDEAAMAPIRKATESPQRDIPMPAQFKVIPDDEPVARPALPRFSDVVNHPYDYGFDPIDWVGYATQIYETIEAARATLGESTDDPEEAMRAAPRIENLKKIEAETDTVVGPANIQVRLFDQTNAASGLRFEIADKLHRARKDLILILATIQLEYRLTERSFGAKGRATKIADVDFKTDYKGADADNKFIKNIRIGGRKLTDEVSVTKPAVTPVAGPQVLLVAGQVKEGLPPDSFEDTLSAPWSPQSVKSITRFTARDRGGGQAVNMGNTNARGYAWATNTPGWNTTRWEWLHIRGASLGGTTGPSNLVLGTRDSNTHMIPFESNLKVLASYAHQHEEFSGVSATWTIDGQVQKHSYTGITIAWQLHAADGTVATDGEATFSPLESSGSPLSKGEVAFLEEALREADPVTNTTNKKRPSLSGREKTGQPDRKKPKREGSAT